ncbi:MAG TPA: response regulator transcription factor [Flavobacterium sp.]|nr:response regulator transcription factor [Flavobacterium sp.]
MTIKVAIVEDEKQIRESLAILIDGSVGFSCIDTYESAEAAIAGIPAAKPDVVLMDIHLPEKDGITCITELKPKCPEIQFLMCTSFEDTDSVFRALKAGATGYLTKTTPPSKILDAIVEVFKGGSPMSSHIARKVVLSFGTENNAHVELEKLSIREKEILHLLSQGLRYKEIADKLFLSTETVRTHIRNIYEKLQVNSRTEALNKTFSK